MWLLKNNEQQEISLTDSWLVRSELDWLQLRNDNQVCEMP